MNRAGSAHLTDEQFAEAALGGRLSLETERHVSSCAGCRAELDNFGTAIGEFRSASRTWSESRSAHMPALRPAAARHGRGWVGGFVPAHGWALAVLLALGIAFPVIGHLRHGSEPRPAVTASTGAEAESDSPEQIARDNQLLAEVHFELTRTDLPAQETGRRGRP